MKYKTLLILGDSTSMSVGMEKEMYPYHLAAMRKWTAKVRIVNCSLPGFTSADACAFFFRNKKKINPLAAVVIYLGNCDAMSSELRKGKYSLFRQCREAISLILAQKKTKTRLKNKLLHLEWNSHFDSRIEAPERWEDFYYNISRIVSACQRRHVPVILVRPQAHVLFPSGVGKGNFIFYKYLGINERIADRVSIEDRRFQEALRLQENREFVQAMEAYRNILFTPGPLSSHLEYQSLIVNNYAVCGAEICSWEEAETLLKLLLKERGTRKEIVLYNLAQISRLKGHKEEYSHRLMEAYEADKSMYRVREAYKRVIDEISLKFTNVSLVDLQDFISDHDYVDHCHPLAEKQRLIAIRIAAKLVIPELKGDQPTTIENWLYNPEYSLGNIMEFHAYFKTFAPFSSEQIRNFLSLLAQRKNPETLDPVSDDIPKQIPIAVEYHLRHPCFSEIKDLLAVSAILPSDVGRFPEYFLFRYLIPYLRQIECTQELSKLFGSSTRLLRSSEQFLCALPKEVIPHIPNDLIFDLEYERRRLPTILQKVQQMLLEHLKQGNRVYERLKTTIFWYFRETLRFGSHSRISMRYERIPLEFMAEGLAVAAVLDYRMGGQWRLEIQRLIGWLEETVQIHEYFCRQFSLQNDCKNLLYQYDSKLMDLAKKVEEHVPQRQSQEMESGKCIS